MSADGVLNALANGHSEIFLRPKQCRLWASQFPRVLDTSDGTKDNTFYKQPLGDRTPSNLPNDDQPDETPQHISRDECRIFSQVPSSSIQNISREWQARFPALMDRLVNALTGRIEQKPVLLIVVAIAPNNLSN
ncbi:hypothetical protein GGR57DRAFT_518775 [Xylariaceae sp. FL1272]|nr:hypothetical protein GGR57DRAFT_518775 [Xylariaceae sp. FL1272]